LGSNSLLMTGSLGATGAGKLLKGWMTDLEITNLPTINGGTLAAALPFSSYVLKSDTASMLTPYIARGDTASMLTKYITTIETATSYAPKASPTFTGTVATAALNVGGRDLSIDSIAYVGDKYALYDGADTIGPYVLASDVVDLSDYAVMLADSTTGAGHYVSDHRGDDIEAALADTVAFDTEELSSVAPLWGDSGKTITFPASDTTVVAVRGKVVFQTADSSLYVCRSTLAAKKWYPLN